ncbi:hypothetical protein ACP70R_019214 [Stipagrostis hirtigluma subsp. patula]
MRRPARVHVGPAAVVQRRPGTRLLRLVERLQADGERWVRPGARRRRWRRTAGEAGVRTIDTEQYMLEMIFHTLMWRYECLTGDAAAANVVYVPYYAGFDAAIARPGGLATAAAGLARHGRPRPLPAHRAGLLGLPSCHERRLGQRPDDLPGHPEHHGAHLRGQPVPRERLRRAVVRV